MKKLVICTHGIGDHQKDFYKEWESTVFESHPKLKDQIEFKGLFWDDFLDDIKEKFPLVGDNFNRALKVFEIENIKEKVGEYYDEIEEYLMDVLGFLFLHDLRERTKSAAHMRLMDLMGNEKKPILIGHSLGSSLLTHLLWDQKKNIGSMCTDGLILMGSPLGIKSPISEIKDLVETMDFYENTPRSKILKRFFGYFRYVVNGNLRLMINQNDIVAADVRFDGIVDEIDPIPFNQGFSDAAIKKFSKWCPDSIISFKDPDEVAKIDKITVYHDVKLYLKRKEFSESIQTFLKNT